MASRDFGFLTLRNISAFQPNGNPVPPNQVLATSGNGIGGFTSTITISSIIVNSIEVSSINNTNQFALSINTNFLNVNSTTTLSTTTINSTLNVNGIVNVSNILSASTIYTDKVITGHIVGSLLEVNTTNTNTIATNNILSNNILSNNIDVNTVSTSIITSNNISVNTLNSNNISTNNIATNFISTYQKIFLFDNNLSSCYLDNIGSTLYVDGHPVITEANISTISSLFWSAGPSGSINNKNFGNNNNNKLVYIGEPVVGGTAPNYTLDVAGTVGIASSLTVSSISNVQNIKSYAISLASTINSSFFIDFTTNISSGIGFDYPVLRFNSQVTSPNIQNKSLTLHMNDGVPTWRSQWESYLPQSMKFECLDFLVSTSNDVNLYGNSTIKLNSFNTYVSNKLNVSTLSTNSIQMNNGTIDINGSNLILDGSININGSTYISSGLTLNGTTPGGYGALKIQGGLVENDIFIRDGSQVNSATNSGYFVGISNNFGGPSTFQIGRVDAGNVEPLKTLYLTQSGNVGIGTSNPQFTLDVNGNLHTSGYLSTNNITMNNGNINFNTSININPYSGSGNINIGTTNNPIVTLGSSGSNNTHRANGNFTINGNNNNNYTLLTIANTSNVSSSVQINMATGGGSYSLYATDNEGSPGGSGLIPSTFQLYSYYPNPLNVLTIYPNGNMSIPGNLTVSGSAISNVACSTITSVSPTWNNFIGKYNFINGDSINSLTLPGSASNGNVIVIRNTGTTNNITISGTIDASGTSILPGKTSSYVYTTVVGPGWYAL